MMIAAAAGSVPQQVTEVLLAGIHAAEKLAEEMAEEVSAERAREDAAKAANKTKAASMRSASAKAVRAKSGSRSPKLSAFKGKKAISLFGAAKRIHAVPVHGPFHF